MCNMLRVAHIDECSGPARMVSLLLSLYFSKRGSPSITTRSSKGVPTTTRLEVCIVVDQIDSEEMRVVQENGSSR